MKTSKEFREDYEDWIGSYLFGESVPEASVRNMYGQLLNALEEVEKERDSIENIMKVNIHLKHSM